MALPPEKITAYKPLLSALVVELLREFEEEQQDPQADEASRVPVPLPPACGISEAEL
ncbi:MAG: hypothetical protein ABIQ86_12810 [Steroidobacteraceae bacterium]